MGRITDAGIDQAHLVRITDAGIPQAHLGRITDAGIDRAHLSFSLWHQAAHAAVTAGTHCPSSGRLQQGFEERQGSSQELLSSGRGGDVGITCSSSV